MPTQDDLLLGQIAVERGKLSPEELNRCFAEMEHSDPKPPLASILLGRGYLGIADFEALLETHPSLLLPSAGAAPLRVADLERRLAVDKGGGRRRVEDKDWSRPRVPWARILAISLLAVAGTALWLMTDRWSVPRVATNGRPGKGSEDGPNAPALDAAVTPGETARHPKAAGAAGSEGHATPVSTAVTAGADSGKGALPGAKSGVDRTVLTEKPPTSAANHPAEAAGRQGADGSESTGATPSVPPVGRESAGTPNPPTSSAVPAAAGMAPASAPSAAPASASKDPEASSPVGGAPSPLVPPFTPAPEPAATERPAAEARPGPSASSAPVGASASASASATETSSLSPERRAELFRPLRETAEAVLVGRATEGRPIAEALRKLLTELDALAQKDAGWAEPIWYRGAARIALGDERRGLVDLSRAAELEPELGRRRYEYVEHLVSGYARLFQPVEGGGWAEGGLALKTEGRAGRARADVLAREIQRQLKAPPGPEAPAWDGAWRRGVSALLEGDATTSVARLREAAEARQPMDAGWAWRDLAFARLLGGDSEGALADLARAVEHDPAPARKAAAHRLRALACWCRGELAKALSAWEDALAPASADAEGFSLRGRIQALRGDAPAARRDQASALALDPQLATAHSQLGLLFLGEGRETEAMEEFLKALERDADEVAGFAALAKARLAAKDTTGAIQVWGRVLGRVPDSGEGLAGRAAARRAAGDLAGAEEDLTRAAAQLPGSAELALERALVRRERGNVKGAIADARQAAQLRPRFAAASLTLGSLLEAERDLPGAIEAYGRAIEADPRSAAAYTNRGLARHKNGELKAAYDDHSKALELAPGMAMAYVNRALVRQMWGDLGGALTDLTKAIELDGKSAIAYVNRALVKRQLDDLKGALADVNTALAVDAKNLLALVNRGELRRLQGDPDGALEDFDEVLESRPDVPEALGGRGMILQRRAKYADAIRDYERFLERAPDHPMVERIRSWLRECRMRLAAQGAEAAGARKE
ncbi:MAG: tetratricopeptide repeat protein [Planctomycetes bacterium]|nr:tetratricopeptide repeat protein [Planctomycetota bacterium]